MRCSALPFAAMPIGEREWLRDGRGQAVLRIADGRFGGLVPAGSSGVARASSPNFGADYSSPRVPATTGQPRVTEAVCSGPRAESAVAIM